MLGGLRHPLERVVQIDISVGDPKFLKSADHRQNGSAAPHPAFGKCPPDAAGVAVPNCIDQREQTDWAGHRMLERLLDYPPVGLAGVFHEASNGIGTIRLRVRPSGEAWECQSDHSGRMYT